MLVKFYTVVDKLPVNCFVALRVFCWYLIFDTCREFCCGVNHFMSMNDF